MHSPHFHYPVTEIRPSKPLDARDDPIAGRAPASASESGQATIEFALVLPVVVLVLFGIALFGIALNDWINETQLASEAARFASVNSEHGTGAEISEEKFLKWVTEQGDSKEFAEGVKAEMCSPTSQVEGYVRVRLSYNYKWFGLANLFNGAGETPIASTATMRIEVPPAKPYKAAFASGKCE